MCMLLRCGFEMRIEENIEYSGWKGRNLILKSCKRIKITFYTFRLRNTGTENIVTFCFQSDLVKF